MKAPKQKKNEKKKSHIPFRLNLLFFIVFLLFSTLILRLAYLQIVQADAYKAEVERTERTTITGSVPRGEIFDSHLNKLVGNEARHAITYTRGKNVPAKQMAAVAYDLADYISMSHTTSFEVDRKFDLSERDLKDFFIARNQEEVRDRLNDDEQRLSGSESYSVMLDKVEESEILAFGDRELDAAAVFKKMNSAYSLSTVNIKNQDVTEEEIARISENLEKFPGIDTGTDWVRHYPKEGMLRSILGSVTSEEAGVPESGLKTYLARGYSRNDRVGRTQLEAEYETVLSGTKSRIETETNSNGDIINRIEQYSGHKGDNLVLSMDIEFQEKVEQIAVDSLAEREGLNKSIYIAAMDPNNGDILGLAGKKVNDDGEVIDATSGIFQSAFNVGSAVKGATILSAYMDGVLDETNNVIVDQPLKLRGSEDISSVFNRYGAEAVNDITALEVSSNVYMARLAMRMGGEWEYTRDMTLDIDGAKLLEKQRRYFNQFGLGVPTGVDFPSDATGLEGQANTAAQGLFYSFGQYDTYTPLQLLQYASVIANGGTRYAPRLVSEIRDTNVETGNVGALKTEIQPKIMNTVDVSDEAMARVQQGFYQVVNGSRGSARSYFTGTPYTSAGKTGTAEALWWDDDNNQITDIDIINITYVGYAPYDDPEIAVAVVVPNLPTSGRTNRENTKAARRVFDAYFKVGEFESDSPSEPLETVEDLAEEAEDMATEEAIEEDEEENTEE
ncbi:Cell division protein FtsI/penicillin-binding protein 2 [Alkalibacterium putridalgicola]|uniref:Penicillin-binding protein n=1 Tax=Alkalibacterium putridalgicola TaxID=426703 RepID=A0A1H7TAX0_9LACT|nr:penicillin-binding protein 2 [Alkalibacterium putridalgicola]GEK89290.1 penicillin-binding protein [Alkalibacterium putridalgicola]SEL81828.1 Cell division protein FtsI/penicillin-binding protein 2 [Alkalibacterium putridalgicola]